MDEIGTPNCPECLSVLQVAGTAQRPYFWCPVCRVARLT
jgi:formamidopyrimidine-DNA glycosylase